MVCYRDMTFCPFHGDCTHAPDCHRPLTEEVMARAAAAKMPICRYADKPRCHSDKDGQSKDSAPRKLNANMTKPWYRYNRNYGLPGSIVLEGTPVGKEGNEITVEMVILSKFIWGRGASANSIFNTGAATLKFQHTDPSVNASRAKLVAKVWRLCKINGFRIHGLPVRRPSQSYTEDLTQIIDAISAFNSTANGNQPV